MNVNVTAAVNMSQSLMASYISEFNHVLQHELDACRHFLLTDDAAYFCHVVVNQNLQ